MMQDQSLTIRTAIAGPESQEPWNMKHEDAEQQKVYAAMKRGFTPFLLHPVCAADCGSLDPSFMEYVNEFDERCYDALPMCVGRTLFEPFEYKLEPALTKPTDAGFKPCTDGAQEMSRMPFPGILLQPCKDGYLNVM